MGISGLARGHSPPDLPRLTASRTYSTHSPIEKHGDSSHRKVLLSGSKGGRIRPISLSGYKVSRAGRQSPRAPLEFWLSEDRVLTGTHGGARSQLLVIEL